MATLLEIMETAKRAHDAGDTEAASRLVNFARAVRAKSKPAAQPSSQLVLPQAYDDTGAKPQPQQDRFGDTIAAATAEPISAVKHYAGEVMDGEKAPLDRLKAAGMTGLAALGTTYAAGAGLVGELAGGSPTNERKLARDLMLMGEVAVPELAGFSSVARAAGQIPRAVAKAGDVAETPAAQTALAAERLGVTPALGTTGKTTAQISAGLEKVPFSGSVIAKDAHRYVADIERAAGNAVERIGNAKTPEGAGDALQTGLTKFADDFKAKSESLYADVGRHIPADMKIEAPETVQMIREALAPYAEKPAIRKRLGLDEWSGIADDLEGGLTWEAATDLRSKIGQSVGKITGPMADMDQGRLKQVYAKLTADLEAAAKQAGPDAEKAWNRAGSYYRAGAKRIEGMLDKTIKADSPERAFEAFVNFGKADRASSDIRRFYAIKKSIPADEWNDVAASIVNRLGRKGDDFSPAKFATEWGKLSKEAKAALLDPRARKEMDDLVALAEGAKRINAERNFSNTGNAAALIATGAGTGTAPISTAAILLTANISARAMTSQRFLRAMNKAARGDTKMMRAIARSESPYAQDATTILRLTAADAAGGGAANANGQIRAVAP